MICAAAVTAQFVAGKATRDALFLSSLDVSTLPTMLVVTSVVSILLVMGQGYWARRVRPGVLVPVIFGLSGGLFVIEWLTRGLSPSTTAILVYLHISAAGPLLGSGFWLIASEGFDPRTAKKTFGRIAGAGTIGGLAGAFVAERVAVLLGVPAMLLVLAGFQLIAAWLIRVLAAGTQSLSPSSAEDELTVSADVPSGLRVVARAPHLRWLVALVLLGTTSAALIEYVFKARAVETFGPGDHLLRFFAVYYAVVSLLTFGVQVFSSRSALERFGLGLAASTPSIALVAASIGSVIVPGFGAVLVARASELVFRGSLFRAGYEVFFTPISPREKRAAKSVIDVAVDRLGDAAGGGLVRLIDLFVVATQTSIIVWVAVATSLAAIIAASRLHRWYVQALASSLMEQGRGFDLAVTRGNSLRAVLHSMRRHNYAPVETGPSPAPQMPAAASSTAASVRSQTPIRHPSTTRDAEVDDILVLRSRNRQRAIHVLARPAGLPAILIPHVIPLLAWEPLTDYALFALRKVAEERIGELTDALIDPRQPDAVRQGLARVFSVCVSQRAADGLLLALDDTRFEVRFQAARSLAAIVDKNPLVRIDAQRIYDVVMKEIDGTQSLGQVFTLLSLVLPREPMQIAFRSLNTDDRRLRGTSLEYLEGILPEPIRRRLWPLLVHRRAKSTATAVAARDSSSATVGSPAASLPGSPVASSLGSPIPSPVASPLASPVVSPLVSLPRRPQFAPSESV